jgi:hypothetical protein
MRVIENADQQGSHAAARAEFSMFTNASAVEDGWILVAPYGDFEGIAREPDGKGGEKKTRAIQRIDKAAVANMTNSMEKHRGLSKFFTAPPLFLGHPNKDPHLYPDKSPKGVFVNAKAVEAGFAVEPILTAEGEHLVASKRYPGISGHWDSEDTGEKTAAGLRVFRPLNFLSAGLVKSPNLPTFLNDDMVEQTKPDHDCAGASDAAYAATAKANKATKVANSRNAPADHAAAFQAHADAAEAHDHAADLHETAGVAARAAAHRESSDDHDEIAMHHLKAAKAAGAKVEITNDRQKNLAAQSGPAATQDMNKSKIIPLLTQAGLAEITNDSTDAQLEAAIGQIATRAARASALETQFTNERAERIGELLGRALESGKITAAEKPDWERRLKADFTNEKAALDKLTPKIKTASAINRGDAKPGEMTAAARTQFCNELIGELAGKHHLDRVKDYNRLFTMAQEARPDLFQGMKRSAFNKPAGS